MKIMMLNLEGLSLRLSKYSIKSNSLVAMPTKLEELLSCISSSIRNDIQIFSIYSLLNQIVHYFIYIDIHIFRFIEFIGLYKEFLVSTMLNINYN